MVRLPTTSSNENTRRYVRSLKPLCKICLPVQFLNLRVEFAVAPRQLVGPLLQVSDWQSRDEFHLRLRVAVLARGSGFGQCGKMVPLLTSEVAFGDAVGDVESAIQLRARIGAIDGLYQFEQADVETVEFGQQRDRIFGRLLTLLHARRARQSLVYLGNTMLTITAFGKCFG